MPTVPGYPLMHGAQFAKQYVNNYLHEDIPVRIIDYRNGWNVDDNPIEFDKSRDDSQISILADEVAQILKVIEKHYKVEPIECLECGGKDVLVVAHTCTIDLAIQSED